MIDKIQRALRAEGCDGWLFFDHHRRDPLAYRILRIPDSVEASRRWYYLVPAEGDPIKLVHKIESGVLDSLPGLKWTYASWTDQQEKLRQMLGGYRRLALQYSPRCAIPLISNVDAGTAELIRDSGTELVSSADLIQEFEARWNREQLDMHLRAGQLVDRIRRDAFDLVKERLRSGVPINEHEVQEFIRKSFSNVDLLSDHGPIVAVNANASDPHYEPTCERCSPIQTGDLLLIDLWAKLNQPQSVYYDITWTGFCGEVIPSEMQNVFNIVRDARKTASAFVDAEVRAGRDLAGWQVDDIARNHISDAGYGDYFFHRTGHSIGTEVHGAGANMDNLESHDERRILPDTCFSIEPGIYLPNFGIRSEVNVFVSLSGAQVTGEEQEQLVRI